MEVPESKWPTPTDPLETRVISNVRKLGCHISYVESQPERSIPDFAYSIGFYATWGQPEVLIIGLSYDAIRKVFTQLEKQIREGLTIAPGTVIEALYEGKDFKCRGIERHVAVDYLDLAFWFYRHLPFCEFPIVQALWPDKDGNYPDEAACNSKVVAFQEAKPLET